MQSKNAIGNLINRYKAVLKKCHLINTLGSFAKVTALCASIAAASFIPSLGHAAPTITWPTGEYFTIEEQDPSKTYFSVFDISLNGTTTSYGARYTNPASPGSVYNDINALVQSIIPRTGSTYSISLGTADVSAGEYGFTTTIDSIPISYKILPSIPSESRRDDNINGPIGTSSNPLAFYGKSGLEGGAIYNSAFRSDAHIYADFIANTATDFGGAIYSDGTLGDITGSFIANTATNGDGGAIYNFFGELGDITGSFIANTATGSGGAIYNNFSELGDITGSFIANTANLNGGAIANIDTLGDITGSFIANTAGSNGGAIANIATLGDITGSFIANTATNNGGAIYTTKSLSFVADKGDYSISGNYVSNDGGATRDHNAIYLNAADLSLTFNVNNGGSYTLDDNVKTNGSTYTFNITGGGTGDNVFNLNNVLHNASAVKVNNAILNFGAGPYGSGGIGNATLTVEGTSTLNNVTVTGMTTITNGTTTFKGTTTLGAVTNNGTTTALNSVTFNEGYGSAGTLNIGDADTAGTVTLAANKNMTIQSGGSLTIVNGSLDTSNGTLTVDGGANNFSTNANGKLIVKAADFGSITDAGAFSTTAQTTIDKQLTHAGNLVLKNVGFTSMGYNAYTTFLSQFRGSAISGDGTVELDSVSINTSTIYLKDIQSGISLPNNVVLGNDATEAAGGTFAAGKTATLGGVTGDVNNSGNLTLTGDVNGTLIDGNAVNKIIGILNLQNGSITGDLTNSGTVTVNGGTNVEGDLLNNNIINVKGGTLSANNFTAASGATTYVGGANATIGDSFIINGDANFNGATIFAMSTFNGFENASAVFAKNISNIDGNIIAGQDSYYVLGTGDRAYALKAFTESGHAWGNGANEVSAALFIMKPQTLADTGSINIDGSMAAINAANANHATFAANSLLVVDATGIGSNAALTATDGTLTVAKDAKLHITAAESGTTVHIVSGFINANSSIAADAWDSDNLTTSTGLQVAKVAAFDPTKGTYSVTITGSSLEDIQESFPAAQGASTEILEELAKVFDVNSQQESIRFFSTLFDDTAGIGKKNPTEVVKILESVLQIAQTGAASGMSLGASFTAANTVLAHLSQAGFNFASSGGQAPAVVQVGEGTSGVSGGSAMADESIKNGMALWLSPMYKYSTVSGISAGAFEHGYNSSLGGLILGADYTVDNTFRMGLAFNLGTGYAESSGDLSQTQNNFDFWGVTLYGAYYKENFSLMADVGFSSISGEFNQDVPAILGSSSLEAHTQSTVWTAGLTAEYTFETDFMHITPHAGVRYMHVYTGSYDTKNTRGTVAQNKSDSQGVWYFPVGVTFSKDVAFDSGWTWTPSLDVGFIAAAGDLHANSVSSIPGVAGSTEYNMQNVDGFAFNGGVGFDLAHADNGISFGLKYNLQASEHETGHMLNASFRLEF